MKNKNKNFITPPMKTPTGETKKTVAKRKDSWFETKLKNGGLLKRYTARRMIRIGLKRVRNMYRIEQAILKTRKRHE